MTQLEIIPLEIVQYQPFLDKATAHACARALCENGDNYYVKIDKPGDPVCATEWVCGSMADSLNLPVAEVKILRLPTGELVIGAKDVGPRIPDPEAAKILSGQANNIFIPQLPEILSQTYAFDLVSGNVDRHLSNFLISLGSDAVANQTRGHLRLIDFGHSDILRSNRLLVPMPSGTPTVRVGRLLREKHPFVKHAATTLLARLNLGRQFIAERALVGLPEEWMPKRERDEFLGWVSSSHFVERLEKVEHGLADGTYL